jgi:CheY-like chemotaxis protein
MKSKILIADTSRDNLYALEQEFLRLNPLLSISSAESSAGLLDKLSDAFATTYSLPGIILLNTNLCGEWQELLKGLKEHPRYRLIPVLVFASHYSSLEVRRAYELGASSFYRQPEGKEEFTQSIRSIGAFWFSIATLPFRPELSYSCHS